MSQIGKVLHSVDDAATEVVRKASPFSIGMAIVLAVIFLGMGSIVYFNRDTIKHFVDITNDVKHLQDAHDRCHASMAVLQAEVQTLRIEIASLKRTVKDL